MTNDVVTTDMVNALTKRVKQLEQLMDQVQNIVTARYRKPDELFADNTMIAQAFRAFLEAEDITGEPISAEELRKMIGVDEQNPNEFSHAISAMREE